MTLAEIDAELSEIREALRKQAKGARASTLETGRSIERVDYEALRRREGQLVRRRNDIVARSTGAGPLGGIATRVRT